MRKFAAFLETAEEVDAMRALFLGKDPDSQVGNSPTLFATDRTGRRGEH